mmetsp:Transcript_2375/g.5446  ORF Transcript_2375/g.5446 Transcript_2375/m.5446 type:complete len:97 (-) Transcript_2375:371-661(-)
MGLSPDIPASAVKKNIQLNPKTRPVDKRKPMTTYKVVSYPIWEHAKMTIEPEKELTIVRAAVIEESRRRSDSSINSFVVSSGITQQHTTWHAVHTR